MKSITLRTYQKNDRPYLEDIIRKTWHYDSICSPKTARRMANLYLTSCLANQTFTRVALVDQRPVGIIMGKNISKHRASLLSSIKKMLAAIRLLSTKDGRKTARIFQGINNLDQELLADTGKNYKGELAFFAIDSDNRGTGIGGQLFLALLSYMRSQDIREFYLFTDSSCNYGFYEHQGMMRMAERVCHVDIPQENKMHFFLYEYKMPA